MRKRRYEEDFPAWQELRSKLLNEVQAELEEAAAHLKKVEDTDPLAMLSAHRSVEYRRIPKKKKKILCVEG